VENFYSPAESFGEIRCAYGHDHEFLEVDGAVRVRATIEDVSSWDREEVGAGVRGIARQVFVEAAA